MTTARRSASGFTIRWCTGSGARMVLGGRETPLQRGHLPAWLTDERRRREGRAHVHRERVRGPARPGQGSHADLPVLGQAHDLQLRLLPGAETAERRARAACRHVGHAPWRRRRRRRRARGRRARAVDRVPADQLPRAPRDRRAGGTDPARVLGRRAAARSSASPSPRSPTSTCCTGPAPTAARSR